MRWAILVAVGAVLSASIACMGLAPDTPTPRPPDCPTAEEVVYFALATSESERLAEAMLPFAMFIGSALETPSVFLMADFKREVAIGLQGLVDRADSLRTVEPPTEATARVHTHYLLAVQDTRAAVALFAAGVQDLDADQIDRAQGRFLSVTEHALDAIDAREAMLDECRSLRAR